MTHGYASILALVVLLPSAAPQFVVEVLESTEKGQRPVVICEATGANFGTDVFSFGPGSVGCAVPSIPGDACRNVLNPLVNSTLSCDNYFALVPRGNCSFSEKAYYVQHAFPIHFTALIVYNHPGQQPIPMSGGKFSDLVDIPVVMVDHACMINTERYSAEKGYLCVVKAKPAIGHFDLEKYLVPFGAVVLFCFIILLIPMDGILGHLLESHGVKATSVRTLRNAKTVYTVEPVSTCEFCTEGIFASDHDFFIHTWKSHIREGDELKSIRRPYKMILDIHVEEGTDGVSVNFDAPLAAGSYKVLKLYKSRCS
ncbi:hypothetical protein QR680_015830 [Steinernema hermaphroditum]|uniref:PA domain-containing protein n=1 Tax=Steinernema hermaphroditum TaxID=289476 RepID=A0AA39H929_9BILA|nr:hypothetical protein QR680_015830 [Steinernema hermaphroditum]